MVDHLGDNYNNKNYITIHGRRMIVKRYISWIKIKKILQYFFYKEIKINKNIHLLVFATRLFWSFITI